MRPFTIIGTCAALLAALPAAGYGQRHSTVRSPRGGYIGSGPFHPSTLYESGGVRIYRGSRQPLRLGGTTIYFSRRGRHYHYYSAPIWGYPYGFVPYPVPFQYGYYYPY